MPAINVCPHCHKKDFIPYVVFAHCENYDKGWYKARCEHCNKVVRINMVRRPVLLHVEAITDPNAIGDWG